VEVDCKIFTVAITAFANTTAIFTTVVAIVGPPLSLLAIVTFVQHIITLKTHIFISFHSGNGNGDGDGDGNWDGSGNSDGNGKAMIDRGLLCASNDTIVAITYFSFYI
jgi:hypothetical protein